MTGVHGTKKDFNLSNYKGWKRRNTRKEICIVKYDMGYGTTKHQQNEKIYYFINWKLLFKGSRCSKWHWERRYLDIQLPSLISIQSWQQARNSHENGDLLFPALIFRSSSERGGMDFKQLRLCKRLALEGQKMSLETVSWPATSRCQEQQGQPVSRQPDEIYWAPSLVTGDLHGQQSYVTLCLHLRQPHWQSFLRETSCQTLFPLMKSCKWTNTMIVHKGSSFYEPFHHSENAKLYSASVELIENAPWIQT